MRQIGGGHLAASAASRGHAERQRLVPVVDEHRPEALRRVDEGGIDRARGWCTAGLRSAAHIDGIVAVGPAPDGRAGRGDRAGRIGHVVLGSGDAAALVGVGNVLELQGKLAIAGLLSRP